jgi:hypothetical protein
VDRLIPGLGLAAALTLGAIVAPPDAVAATAIFQRLGVPRRLVTILEGESLINTRRRSSPTGSPSPSRWALPSRWPKRASRSSSSGWAGYRRFPSSGRPDRGLAADVGPDARIMVSLLARSRRTCRPRPLGVSGVLAAVVADSSPGGAPPAPCRPPPGSWVVVWDI